MFGNSNEQISLDIIWRNTEVNLEVLKKLTEMFIWNSIDDLSNHFC